MKNVHLIGIGGSGLSAIAQVLLESGYRVSGSDRQLSPLARRLQAEGVQVFTGHQAENIAGADLVVRSSAVPDDNPEVQAARLAGIPVYKRSDFLGQLMNGRQSLAVAGTHGKTTTTAMLAWMLVALGQDPAYIIGGVSANLNGNAHAGRGPHFVIEADEYDRMFLGLTPQAAIITNIEYDHPDCYPTPEDFYAAFVAFAGRILPGGTLLACADDRGAARLLMEMGKGPIRTLSYGIHSAELDYRAIGVKPNARGGFDFEALAGRESLATVSLQAPGRHNVLNALATLAVAHILGLPLQAAAQALADFSGTGRRFELCGEAGGVTVIDDYAHHPTEIRATLAAARARFPGRRIWAVWQPHTYSRTRTLLDDFAAAFDDADCVLATEVFPARESRPADGFSAAQVVAAMRRSKADLRPEADPRPASFVATLAQASAVLLERLRPGDVLFVLSAGDADQISVQVLDGLQRRQKENEAAGK